MIKWKNLTAEEEIDLIKSESEVHPVLIFKHSTRCSISASAKDRLERKWDDTQANGIVPYYLDLLNYRSVSNKIAEEFGVMHQSPQVLLIRNGKAIFNTSHMAINFDEIKQQPV